MDISIGDTVHLSDEGKDLTCYWTTPRRSDIAPEWKRRSWASRPFTVRQISESPSGKVYYRLHRMAVDKATGLMRTRGVMLVAAEHIAGAT